MDKLFIPIMLGTNRKGRMSQRAAKFIQNELSTHENVESQLIDVRDFDLPQDDYGPALKEKFPEYKQTIEKADGIIFVVPEYNHSYPGRLKSVLDILYEEYSGKTAGLVTVSAGGFAGVRLAENIAPLFKTLQLIASPTDLNISTIEEAIAPDGSLLQEDYKSRAEKFLTALIDLTQKISKSRD